MDSKIKLDDKQQVQDVSLTPGENGGCMLTYCIYTPAKTHTESTYDRHNEVFGEDQMEEALDKIKELFRANINSKKV
jgi:hypothetical protein